MYLCRNNYCIVLDCGFVYFVGNIVSVIIKMELVENLLSFFIMNYLKYDF